MSPLNPLDLLIEALPDISSHHVPGSRLYAVLRAMVLREVPPRFGPDHTGLGLLPPFGSLDFPYRRMGAINSLDLFGLDELILFAFYWVNRKRYRRVADIGANIGLHSIILARCGYQVRSYEPDPQHIESLRRNLDANKAETVEIIQAAVSSEPGEHEFVRVLGNTTGSHLAGAKPNPYGELERFAVRLSPISPILEWADLVKIDAEGHERQILLATTAADWRNTDAVLEVGSTENAAAIFTHARTIGLRLFAQKLGWSEVVRVGDMPVSYRDGSLFLTIGEGMPWQA